MTIIYDPMVMYKALFNNHVIDTENLSIKCEACTMFFEDMDNMLSFMKLQCELVISNANKDVSQYVHRMLNR